MIDIVSIFVFNVNELILARPYFVRLCGFQLLPRNIIRAKYYQVFHLQNLIHAKYLLPNSNSLKNQEKYLKIENRLQKVDTNNIINFCNFSSLYNKSKTYDKTCFKTFMFQTFVRRLTVRGIFKIWLPVIICEIWLSVVICDMVFCRKLNPREN